MSLTERDKQINKNYRRQGEKQMEDYVKQIDNLSELQAKALLLDIRQGLRDHVLGEPVINGGNHALWSTLYRMYENNLEEGDV